MSSLIFSSKYAIKPSADLSAQKRLSEVIKELAEVNSYESSKAFVHAPQDALLIESIKTLIAEKKYHTIDAMIVVGIGGSNLALKAIHELLQHTGSNTSKKELFFAETVDPEYTDSLYKNVDDLLKNGKKVLLVIITKSGLTTETMALGSLFIELVQKHYKSEYHNCVVAITDAGSPLANIAKQNKFPLLTIPEHVGGRYSALTAVGLFPAAVLGYDIEALCEGARTAQSYAFNTNERDNPVAHSALMTYQHYQAGTRISNLFLFSTDAESLGHWYRQLIAESLGKIKTKSQSGSQMSDVNLGKSVGIVPIVSIGSTDLHSMVQLYFANPISILTTFVTFGSRVSLNIPKTLKLDTLSGKSVHSILHAIETGTMQAYQEAQLPFMTIHMREKSERAIGEFMQCKMIETVMLARLLEVNPFDQPEVERYKQQTRKILAHE